MIVGVLRGGPSVGLDAFPLLVHPKAVYLLDLDLVFGMDRWFRFGLSALAASLALPAIPVHPSCSWAFHVAFTLRSSVYRPGAQPRTAPGFPCSRGWFTYLKP